MGKRQIESDTKQIVHQFCITVEKEQFHEECHIQARKEVKEMLRLVKVHCDNNDTVKNITVNLIEFLSGEDKGKARTVFVNVADAVFLSSGCEVSWGRIVAIFVFCYNIIKLLAKENKRSCIPSISLWFENFLSERLNMINPHGNEKDCWEDFLNFTGKLEECKNNSLFLFSCVLSFITVLTLYICTHH